MIKEKLIVIALVAIYSVKYCKAQNLESIREGFFNSSIEMEKNYSNALIESVYQAFSKDSNNRFIGEGSYYLGEIYRSRNDLDSSLFYYEKSLSFGYSDSSTLFSLMGLAYLNAGKEDEAIEYYRIAYETNPKNGRINYNLGNLLVKQNKCSEAIDFFISALAFSYREEWVYMKLYTCFFEINGSDETNALCLKNIEEYGDDPVSLFFLVKIAYDNHSESEETSIYYNRLIKMKGGEKYAEDLNEVNK